MKKKVISVLLATAMLATVLAGCGKEGPEETKQSSSSAKVESKVESSSDKVEEDKPVYPLDTDQTFTYFMSVNANWTSYAQNYGETEFAKALEEKTGVKIEYVHPSADGESQMISLFASSGEMPDIVETNWMSFPGGAQAAVEDGLIISLNEYLENGDLPNLKAYFDANPDVAKQCMTDDGTYYCFPYVRGSEKLRVTQGPIIRKDWMEELGLETPKTVEEMENILVQFKEKKGATAALTAWLPQCIQYAGAVHSFYLEGDVVKWGALEDSFKSAIETLNRWYANDLVYKDLPTLDNNVIQAAVLNGEAGAVYGAGGSALGTWLDLMKDSDTSFDVTGMAITYIPHMGNISAVYPGYGTAAISAKCKDPLTAAKYLDYGYSEEGIMLYNFGVEDLTYTMVDGKPIYTDLITNNPDGLTLSQAMTKYFRSAVHGPFVQQAGYIEQYYGKPQQQEALVAWTTNFDEAEKRTFPSAAVNTDEEKAEYSAIFNEVNNYVNEQSIMFIMGTRSLDEYDDFIAEIKKMNVDRMVELKQIAYDRVK